MFDRLYIVHLPNEKRRVAMDAQLGRLGWSGTYLHAKSPVGAYPNFRRNPTAEFGCSLSHIKCVVRALADGAQRPLFIEDDIQIGDAGRLAQAMAELPPDWDVLYLGGHPRSDTRKHSANLVRVGTFSFAEAYLLNRKALRPFLDFWLDRVGQPTAMYDLVLGEFASMVNGFCVFPTLTVQPPGPSQISRKVEDKSNLVTKAWAKHAP